MVVSKLLSNIRSSIVNKPYSHLFFHGERANWVLNWEMTEICNITRELGIMASVSSPFGIFRQSIFYNSKYIFLHPRRHLFNLNNVALPYFHGYPTSEDQIAIKCFKGLEKKHTLISRIQVSHSKMHDFILETGIDASKVFRIPIAVNSDFFSVQTRQSKIESRQRFGIPQQAVVIGSFQKDGNGWGQGLEPKRIKGPDVFLETIKRLKYLIPELYILLSGPARGYVIKGLEQMNVPYKHIFFEHYPDIGKLFQCLDLYIIASREEGGPKAVLESMVSGVPLVTTKVGQAMDLVEHGKNGFMTEIEDAEGLAYWSNKILSESALKESVVKQGLDTANNNTYNAHKFLWKEFFDGFVSSKRIE